MNYLIVIHDWLLSLSFMFVIHLTNYQAEAILAQSETVLAQSVAVLAQARVGKARGDLSSMGRGVDGGQGMRMAR